MPCWYREPPPFPLFLHNDGTTCCFCWRTNPKYTHSGSGFKCTPCLLQMYLKIRWYLQRIYMVIQPQHRRFFFVVVVSSALARVASWGRTREKIAWKQKQHVCVSPTYHPKKAEFNLGLDDHGTSRHWALLGAFKIYRILQTPFQQKIAHFYTHSYTGCIFSRGNVWHFHRKDIRL